VQIHANFASKTFGKMQGKNKEQNAKNVKFEKNNLQ